MAQYEFNALVLEDSTTQARIILNMLERRGVPAHLAFGASQALDLSGRQSFDIILADLHLGDEFSPDYFEALADRWPGAQIIAMTTGRMHLSEELSHARAKGAAYALKKPFSEMELNDVLADAERRQAQQKRRLFALVVDDCAVVRRVASASLREAGFRVAAVGGVAEAIDRLGYCDIDCVVMDIFMPGTSGLEGIRIVREIWPDVGVVAMSGGFETSMNLSDALRAAEKIGADYCLPKPFSAEQIQFAVRSTALLRRASEDLAA